MAAKTEPARDEDKRGLRETHIPADFDVKKLFNSNPYDLDLLPKIEGWIFKWVRSSVLGKEDGANVQKQMTAYWRPVLLDDLKSAAVEQNKDLSFITQVSWGSFDGIAGTHDMMLMMRPEKVEKGYQDYLKEMNFNQERTVETQFSQQLPHGFQKMRPALIDED